MREILGTCAKILGGEPGPAAHLRRNLLGHTGLGGRSLPLDVGDKDDIPWQIRRAVSVRDAGTCQWPGGCGEPAYAYHPHHLVPRAQHGPTCTANLLTLCYFHHEIAVHRWGWNVKLHGTATATSPDGTILRGAVRPPPPRPAAPAPPGRPRPARGSRARTARISIGTVLLWATHRRMSGYREMTSRHTSMDALSFAARSYSSR